MSSHPGSTQTPAQAGRKRRGRLLCWLALFLALFLVPWSALWTSSPPVAAQAPAIRYVKPAASGDATGNDWNNEKLQK